MRWMPLSSGSHKKVNFILDADIRSYFEFGQPRLVDPFLATPDQ